MKITTIITIIKLLEEEISMAKFRVANLADEADTQKSAENLKQLEELEAAYADLNRAIADISVTLEV